MRSKWHHLSPSGEEQGPHASTCCPALRGNFPFIRIRCSNLIILSCEWYPTSRALVDDRRTAVDRLSIDNVTSWPSYLRLIFIYMAPSSWCVSLEHGQPYTGLHGYMSVWWWMDKDEVERSEENQCRGASNRAEDCSRAPTGDATAVWPCLSSDSESLWSCQSCLASSPLSHHSRFEVSYMPMSTTPTGSTKSPQRSHIVRSADKV